VKQILQRTAKQEAGQEAEEEAGQQAEKEDEDPAKRALIVREPHDPAQPEAGAGVDPAPGGPVIAETARASRWHRLLGAMQQFELALFQPEILTLVERARQADWMPDDPDTWCHRCGEPIGPHERQAAGCRACHDQKVPWERFVRLGPLEGALRQWVHEIKFARGHRLARELGRLLGNQIALTLDGERHGPDAGALASLVVTPVPTTYRRRLVRGIDHARQIALGVSETLGVPCRPLLDRDHARPQRGLSRTDRLRNARGVFRARPAGNDPPPGLVVLVDDVRTTGATLASCVRELRKSMGEGVRVCVATAAVTKPERDR
jgi:predicted amidophosphoribosyltransferase